MTDPVTPPEITRFWLDEVGAKGWYASTAALDQTIRDRFLAAWEDAETLAPVWAAEGPQGALAALILTDQFPRNMFRDDPRAFATDALALRIADRAIAQAQETVDAVLGSASAGAAHAKAVPAPNAQVALDQRPTAR